MWCNVCRQSGHSGSQCRRVRCYNCNGFGHIKRDCSTQAVAESSIQATDHTPYTFYQPRVDSVQFPVSVVQTNSHRPNTHLQNVELRANQLFMVEITLTNEARVIENWLLQHPSAVYGMDLEWEPNFRKGQVNPVALLQLATEVACLVVQLLYLDHFPKTLKDLLVSPYVTLAGVGIKQDARKIEDDYGWMCEGLCDLSALARVKVIDLGLQTSLKALVKHIFGHDAEKSRAVTMSNWALEYLSPQQVKYAAQDAWLCEKLYRAFDRPPLRWA